MLSVQVSYSPVAHMCLLLSLFSFIVPMLPGDGGPFGPPEVYHIPFQPIADPVAAARARERRRKIFAPTKAAFPDLRVPV